MEEALKDSKRVKNYFILEIQEKFTDDPIKNCVIIIQSLLKKFSEKEVLSNLKNAIQKNDLSKNKELIFFLNNFINEYGFDVINKSLRIIFLGEKMETFKKDKEEFDNYNLKQKDNEKNKENSTNKIEKISKKRNYEDKNNNIINDIKESDVDKKSEIFLDEDEENNKNNNNRYDLLSKNSIVKKCQITKYEKKRLKEKEYLKRIIGKEATLSIHIKKDNTGNVYSFCKNRFKTSDYTFSFNCSTKKCDGKGIYNLQEKKFTMVKQHTISPEEHFSLEKRYKSFYDKLKMIENLKGIQLFSDNSTIEDIY